MKKNIDVWKGGMKRYIFVLIIKELHFKDYSAMPN